MIRLHKIAFRPLLNYPTFWILLALHLILCAFVVFGMENFITSFEVNGNALSSNDLKQLGFISFPDIWHNITYVAGYFKFILALIIIISVSNDFTYKVLRQQVINGLSHEEYLGTKLVVIIWLALVSTLALGFTGLYMGLYHTPHNSLALALEKVDFIGAYFIQLIAYLSLSLIFVLIIKRSGLSIGLLILYTWVIEPIAAYSLPEHMQKFLPLNNLNNLIQFPYRDIIGEVAQESISLEAVIIAVVYILLFNGIAYSLIRYRDL